MKKVIYDFGANNGDDIPYYLMKSDYVVAVEANPILCQQIKDKFHHEIKQGRLVVENCVITAEEASQKVDFYIHDVHHVLSQLPEPPSEKKDNFTKITLPAKSAERIIHEHGEPYYIKIDIERYDSEILKALHKCNIYPPFISAESHNIEVFTILVCMGYRAFKLVEGSTISEKYSDCIIKCSNEEANYSFPHHSAGPFGDDIEGAWMNADNFIKLLVYEGLGWKDIHATRVREADPTACPSLKIHCIRAVRDKLSKYITNLFAKRFSN